MGGFVTGSYATNSETATIGGAGYGRGDGFEILGYINRSIGDDYSDGSGNTVAGTGADMISGLGKLAYEGHGHRIEFAAERVNDGAARPYRANIGSIIGSATPLTRVYDMDRSTYSLNYSQPDAVGLWDPRVVLSYSQTELSVPDPAGSVGETGSLSGRIENAFNLSATDSITAGVDFYRDKARYYDPTVDMNEQASNLGAYAQARVDAFEPLSLSFGLRADQQWFEGVDGTEIDNAGLSGNVSAAVDVTDFLTVSAGYSNVWGGITLAENFIMNPGWTYDEDSDGVRAESYTAGLEAHHAGFTFGARIFRTAFTDARRESYRGAAMLTEDFETRGYSLNAGYNWGAGFMSVNFTDTRIRMENGDESSYSTQYLGAPLGEIIALEASHRFDSVGVRIGGTAEFALENEDAAEDGDRSLPPYEVVNLYGEYQPSMADFLTLRLEANNIFDETYSDRATYGQEFSTVEPLREPGRSFLLKATATF